MSTREARVVGIDLSLTSTGLADSYGQTRRVQTKPAGTGVAEVLARLHTISEAVSNFANVYVVDPAYWEPSPALVVVEGPSFASTGGQQHTRSGLWWMAVDAVNDYGIVNDPPIPILVVPPTTRAMYAAGKGNAGKDEVLASAIKRYPAWDITGNDIADAVVLCAIGARLLGQPIEGSLPKANLRALDKLTLPKRIGD